MPDPTPAPVRTLPALGRWLGLAATALVIPLLFVLAEPALDPGRQPVAVSAGAVWAAMLAALLAGLAVTLLLRPGRGAVRRGVLLGTGLATVAAGVTLGYGVVVGPAPEIAACNVLPRAEGRAAVDGRASVDGRAVSRISAAPADPAAVTSVIAGLAAVPIEDHGIERFGGVDARRCSIYVDGDAVVAAMPPLATLSDAGQAAGALSTWRGQLEWWTSADGLLVGTKAAAGGHPVEGWPGRGVHGRLAGELRLVREDGQ
jgi:hypothetical protein